MPDTVLSVKNVNKTYSGIQVLHDVSFSLRKGEVHALMGENGAGKTTLIKIISGIEQPDDGSEIFFDDKPTGRLSAQKSMSMGLSVLYQDISLFPNLSIAENIYKGLETGLFVSMTQMYDKAAAAMEIMGVELDLSQKVEEISVGKQQIVAIARAITCNSRIIVMDEPTAALSSSEIRMLFSIVKGLREKGISIIYISHKLDEIFELADRISVLRDGYLIETNDVDQFDHEKLIRQMVGRELRFIPMQNEEPPDETVLFEVEGLSNAPHFQNISFKVRKYEVLGLTGLVGAGRSELAQTIFGLMKAKSGRVMLNGNEIKIDSPADAIENGVCYLPEDRRTQGLFQGKDMTTNITVVTLHKMLNRLGLISRKLEVQATSEYIERLSIRPNNPALNIESMSGGNQQKALIARWLNAQPLVLIVDEPTSGVDVGAKLEIHKLLRALAKQGVCVILISADLPEILALSDRILVMRSGRLVNEFSSKDATQENLLKSGLTG